MLLRDKTAIARPGTHERPGAWDSDKLAAYARAQISKDLCEHIVQTLLEAGTVDPRVRPSNAAALSLFRLFFFFASTLSRNCTPSARTLLVRRRRAQVCLSEGARLCTLKCAL